MNICLFNGESKKAFISIITLFFISIFLLFTFTDNPNQSINDFIIIDQAETQKATTIKDFERIVSYSLNVPEDNPELLKILVNTKLISYLEQKDFFVYNIVTNKQKPLTFSELNNLSRVIVFKPNEYTTIKRYILTNDSFKNNFISFEVKTNKYVTKYSFPEAYEVFVIVYN